MGKENIEKYSARYALLKSVAGFWHNNVFYRKVIVLGSENIKPDDHVIFAPNHQNALMDALAVLFTHKGQPIFLARADIFKRKTIAAVLYFLKILPVYRIRDGFSSVKGNDEIFLKTIDVLKNNNGLVILPEGDHAGFRRLRQLKKGICRVAFQSDEATGFTLNIKIIPVGLEFSNYSRFRQVLTVAYGKPIEVSEYFNSYKISPERALNELRSRLSDEMKGIMVHIESEQDYEAIDELRGMINGRFSDDIRFPKLFRDRILVNKLNLLKTSDRSLYDRICSLSIRVQKKSKELKIYPPPSVPIEEVERLKAYHWPGNVRELENLIERELIHNRGKGSGGRLQFEHLEISTEAEKAVVEHRNGSKLLRLDQIDSLHIRQALEISHGRISGPTGAAQLLGINPNTLRNRMIKLGIPFKYS